MYTKGQYYLLRYPVIAVSLAIERSLKVTNIIATDEIRG
jgi:hypothetical protein